jgi:hypothetical protein
MSVWRKKEEESTMKYALKGVEEKNRDAQRIRKRAGS